MPSLRDEVRIIIYHSPMYYLISYDISNDRTRLLAVKFCKQAGLVRIQRSVFAGASTPLRVKAIEEQLKPLLEPKTDSLSIQPLDEKAFRNWLTAGMEIDKTEIARRQGVVFL